MNTFEKIKNYYNSGLWNKTRVKNMVIREIITEYEYFLITGEEYLKYE